MNSRQITLIMSTYNWPEALDKVFRGLQNQTTLPGEIIIADDGSREPTGQVIEAWKNRLPAPVNHVWHKDLGFRKTIILNQATAIARGDYVVFLDGDCVPDRRFIEDHTDLAEKGFWVQGRRCFVKESSVNSFELHKANRLVWLLTGRIGGGFKAFRFPRPVVYRDTEQRGILGCNMGFWREDLMAVNGLDEEYFGWGVGEDSDLGSRLYHLGRPRKLVYGRAIIFHLNHPPLSKDHLPSHLNRLQNTLKLGKIRCTRGLDQHVSPPAVNGSERNHYRSKEIPEPAAEWSAPK